MASMTSKLLNEQHLEFLTFKKEAAQARLSLSMSKCHIVGNHMSLFICCYVAAQFSTVMIPTP